MRLLIVDDERPARDRLRRLLAGIADVQVVGAAADGEAALRLTAEHAPDALLLDIQMPGVDGLDVAASLPDPAPAIVFVTAHDHYALPAFDAAALDYLLKPVDPERLARALQRIRERLAVPGAHRPPPRQLLIPDRARTHVIAVTEIDWLEAADNYVVVHAGNRAPLMRRPLKALLDDLGSEFVRTHRSAAVALGRVRSLQERDKGDAVLLLHGGAQVPLSRQFRAAVLSRLRGTASPPH